MQIRQLIILMILEIIAALRLPFLIIGAPRKLPIARPTTPDELISVL